MSWKYLLLRLVSALSCLPQKRNTNTEIVKRAQERGHEIDGLLHQHLAASYLCHSEPRLSNDILSSAVQIGYCAKFGLTRHQRLATEYNRAIIPTSQNLKLCMNRVATALRAAGLNWFAKPSNIATPSSGFKVRFFVQPSTTSLPLAVENHAEVQRFLFQKSAKRSSAFTVILTDAKLYSATNRKTPAE